MVTLYVEGGGNSAAVRDRCRKGFGRFIAKAGFKSQPRIIARGGRKAAYDGYSDAIKKGEQAMLLVDSEGPINLAHQQGQPDKWQPWQQLEQQQADGWTKPPQAADTDCHFMVQLMESWLLADRDVLATYYGQGFRPNSLPAAARPIEDIPKQEVLAGLKAATRDCKTKSEYSKGQHSFELLGLVDPHQVTAKSGWANRFVTELQQRQGRAA